MRHRRARAPTLIDARRDRGGSSQDAANASTRDTSTDMHEHELKNE
jgi:hypothetical protein